MATVAPMDDTERVGQRIAAARKSLDMTQTQLAAKAKVSKSMLAKVESGHAAASTNWIGAVARALAVDVGYLTGAPHLTGPADNVTTHRLMTTVRQAVVTWDLLPPAGDVREPSIDRLATDVLALGELRRAAAYTKLAAQVPGVLLDLRAAQQSSTGSDLEQVYGLLANTYRAVNSLAHKLGYLDMSMLAIERMDWAASHAGDPLLPPMVNYLRSGALLRIGEHDAAVQLLQRAITAVEPAAELDPNARAVLGCLHMKLIALYGAAADSDRVAVHHAEAARLADGTPDRVIYETVFGPANVELHALAARVDLGQPTTALEVAHATTLPKNMARERVTHYYTDLARAYLLNGDADRAIDALYEARSIAPIHFSNSSVVRNTIQEIASHQRRATTGLRSLANSAGIKD